jgi:hypothetical protein
MNQRLRFFEEAAAEIEHERAWYRSKSEVAEAGFLRELEHALQAVTDRPRDVVIVSRWNEAIRVSKVPVLSRLLRGG